MGCGQKSRLCANFKSLDDAAFGHGSKTTAADCKGCAYFSPRNCGRNVITAFENKIVSV